MEVTELGRQRGREAFAGLSDGTDLLLSGYSPEDLRLIGRFLDEVRTVIQDTDLMAGVRVGTLLDVVRAGYPDPAPLPKLIDDAGIGGLLNRRIDRLSAGQRQRVRFALAAAG